MDFVALLRSYPVIPALRFEGKKTIDLTFIRPGGPCFLLDGNINTIQSILEKIEKHFSTFFLHLDLFSGLYPDHDGLIFLKNYFQAINGIIFPFIQKQIPIRSLPPIICGGFIRNHKEVKAILQSGATAISTSSPDLWTIE